MRTTCLSCTGLLWLLTLCAVAQQTEPFRTMKSMPLEITFNKTSSIVFPAVITSVDRGSQDILTQKAKGVQNVLQLKAARMNFPETNLTVITADGTLHQFTILYAREPGSLSVNLSDVTTENASHPPVIFKSDLTESDMETHAANITNAKPAVKFKRVSKHKIHLLLKGVYILNNVMFYHMRIQNESNIDYDVDFLRFYIHDRANVKRTASQEVDVIPIYVYGNDKTITGKSTQDIVYAVEKFTIPEAKHLVVEMFEHNGGRNLNLFIRNKTIVNARPVPR